MNFLKWALGAQTIEWFQSNGTALSSNKFKPTNSGIHTVYYENKNQEKRVYTFNIKPEDISMTIDDAKVGDLLEIEGELFIATKYRTVLKTEQVGYRQFDSAGSTVLTGTSMSNIGYWLNNIYLPTMSLSIRNKIEEESWDCSTNTGGATKVTLSVGLLSRYSPNGSGYTAGENLALQNSMNENLTPTNSDNPYQMWYSNKRTSTHIAIKTRGDSTVGSFPADEYAYVHPAIKLFSGTPVKLIKRYQ